MPYDPYFAECPGLSALPLPPIVKGNLHVDISFCCLELHTEAQVTVFGEDRMFCL